MSAILSDVDLLRTLVAFDSTSDCSNLPIADFISDYLDRTGVTVRRNPSEDGRKTNLLARVGPERDDGEGLVLSGHMDVVPALEPGWGSSPFELTERGGKLFGRGTADMKSFLAISINALLRAADHRSDKPLVLLFTYDEETGTFGARRFVETWTSPLPRATVIGEPTSLRVVHAHKGHLRIRLTCTGRSAHSGYPHLGKNAIESAAHAIGGLAALRDELEQERPEHASLFPEVPFVPLNIATIRGGSAVNIVPERCEIEVGLRPLPGMDSDTIIARVRQAVSATEPPELQILSDSPPMLLPPDNPFHRRLCGLLGQNESSTVNYATDAGWFQTVGMECVLFGPGSIEVAHRPDEFVPVDEMKRASSVLDLLIRSSVLAA
jgi:acetylornithine deacetylase